VLRFRALDLALLWGAAALYAASVRLPFFWDDVVHLRYASRYDLLFIVSEAGVIGYYRPVVNALLHLSFVLDVQHAPPLWHALPVLTHVLNTALVGAVARRLGWRRGGRWVSMALFATYPLHFQAVVWVLAWFHPLVTACLLGGLLLADSPHPWRVRLGLFLACLAPFIHENGVLFVGLWALWIWQKGADWRAWWRGGRWPALASLVYLGLSWRAGVFDGQGENSALFADLADNLPYVGMALAYAPAFLARAMLGAGLGSVALALLMFGLLCLGWGRGRETVFALGWFGMALLPTLTLLRADYLAQSPRLFYLAGVGVALMGGLLWTQKMLLRAPLVAATLLMSVVFVRERLALHQALATGYADLFSLIEGQDLSQPQKGMVWAVNAPRYLESERHSLPLGKMGAIFLTDYFALPDFVWANTGREVPALQAVAFYPTFATPPHTASAPSGLLLVDYGTLQGELRGARALLTFGVEGDVYRAAWAGERVARPAQLVAEFEGGIALAEWGARWDEAVLRLTLVWHKTDAQSPNFQPFVHVLCEGQLVQQIDRQPLGGLYHLGAFQVGETWREVLTFAGLPRRDCWRIRLGLYDPLAGRRAVLRQPISKFEYIERDLP